MTKSELIEMIESLNAKKKAAKQVLKTEALIESRASIERHIRNINSVCDRLAFNFNMLPASEKFLNDTVAEAELLLEH